MRFLGNIEAKIDAKGRVFLPVQFRKILQSAGQEGLVMRKDIHQNCLVLYPENVWNGVVDKLRSRLSRWDSAQQMLFRQFVSDAEIIGFDGSGRILIPKKYLKMCCIDQEVKFTGLGETIEIWSKEGSEACFMAPADFGRMIEETMKEEKSNDVAGTTDFTVEK